MARGQNLVILPSQNTLVDTLSREVKNSAAILNPNDGVIYVRLNSRVMDVNPASWDWKLPSQSYGLFPGPWQSLGLYYLDQSGAGHTGEVTIYDSDVKLDVPDIHSIGRALQTQATTLDVLEGTVPSNPAAGVLRLWSDNLDQLHGLDNAGIDEIFVDTRQVGIVTTTMLAAHAVIGAPLVIIDYKIYAITVINVWNNSPYTGTLVVSDSNSWIRISANVNCYHTAAPPISCFVGVSIDGAGPLSYSQFHSVGVGYSTVIAVQQYVQLAAGIHSFTIVLYAGTLGLTITNLGFTTLFVTEEKR